MGWWFGRKSAPADARPFVPAWLRDNAAEEGFARSIEGMTAYERSSGTFAVYRAGGWEMGIVRAQSLVIGGEQVVGARAAAIESPAGGTIIDVQGRAAIDAILGTLRQHGLIAA
jgi:hypothetical protein